MSEAIKRLIKNQQTVVVLFNGSGKGYSYRVPCDWNVRVGDTLVVDSPLSGMTTVVVSHVYDSVACIHKATKWAVQKVDTTFYNEAQNIEKQIKAKEQEDRKTAELRAELLSRATQYPKHSAVRKSLESAAKALR